MKSNWVSKSQCFSFICFYSVPTFLTITKMKLCLSRNAQQKCKSVLCTFVAFLFTILHFYSNTLVRVILCADGRTPFRSYDFNTYLSLGPELQHIKLLMACFGTWEKLSLKTSNSIFTNFVLLPVHLHKYKAVNA